MRGTQRERKQAISRAARARAPPSEPCHVMLSVHRHESTTILYDTALYSYLCFRATYKDVSQQHTDEIGTLLSDGY